MENGQLRSYVVGKVDGLLGESTHFVPNPDVASLINDDDDIWYSAARFEVVMTVDKDAARFFLERRLLPRQELVEQRLDGSILLRCSPVHSRQISPIVRYWIPHARVVEPLWLADELRRDLHSYIHQS